jgi:hypothetical protein
MPNPFMGDNTHVDDDKPTGDEERGSEGRNADAEGADDADTKSGEGDGGKHPLFDEAEGVKKAAVDLFTEEDDVEVAEVEGEGEDAKVKLTTFKKRVGSLTRKRREAEKEAQSAATARVQAEAERDAIKDQLAGFRQKYADNPELAQWDSKFMETLEALAKQSPDIAKLADTVKQYMDGKDITAMTMINQPQPDTKPEADPKLSKILVRDARRTVADALPGVKPGFVKVLQDHIVASVDDLADLTEEQVVDLSRAYIKEAGFTPQEILANAKPTEDPDEDSDKKKDSKKKPATSGRAKGKASDKPTEGGDESRPNEDPKSFDEWAANRNKRLNSFLESLDKQD